MPFRFRHQAHNEAEQQREKHKDAHCDNWRCFAANFRDLVHCHDWYHDQDGDDRGDDQVDQHVHSRSREE